MRLSVTLVLMLRIGIQLHEQRLTICYRHVLDEILSSPPFSRQKHGYAVEIAARERDPAAIKQ